ncbi:GntR family transcriptional regulator [Agaribacterium haliotis]|uniref:GntR family transcriptional regulator n=1 Tax=Agaribacterium haliotis TaxID=2013869 RepID=UPI000BB5924B|nr:GntR family transcriptional regulator [Agaribacterium haliotis]
MNTLAKDSFQQEGTGLSRVEYAYRKIKANITNNTFPSGYQILEPELAEQLGVSRTPVREALIRLEADNLIQLIPRRGMRVTPLNFKDIAELNELIGSLVLTAIRSVCAPARNANFDYMVQYLADMHDAAERNDNQAWVEAEDKYVIALMALTGNFRLKALAANFLEQMRRAKFVVQDYMLEKSSYYVLHAELLQALKTKNVANAFDVAKRYQNALNALFSEVQNKYQIKEF